MGPAGHAPGGGASSPRARDDGGARPSCHRVAHGPGGSSGPGQNAGPNRRHPPRPRSSPADRCSRRTAAPARAPTAAAPPPPAPGGPRWCGRSRAVPGRRRCARRATSRHTRRAAASGGVLAGSPGPVRAVDVRVWPLALAVVEEVLLLLPGEVGDGPTDGVEAVGALASSVTPLTARASTKAFVGGMHRT